MHDDYKFLNRYCLRGRLTARTPVHVGDGDALSLRTRLERLGKQDEVTRLAEAKLDPQYNSFATTIEEAAVIPGSTLKGVLRAWIERHGFAERLVTSVFGTRDGGGKAEFLDAPLITRATAGNKHRWWDERRGTCLAPGVSLDPKTRTAKDRLLYYTEFVPEGSEFAVTVTGQDLSEEERDLLLFAFRVGFDAEDAVRVGTETADGWGLMRWRSEDLGLIEAAEVQSWLQRGAPGSYQTAFRSQKKDLHGIEQAAMGRYVVMPAETAILLELRLEFEGAVLVNDPSQFRKRNERTGEQGVGHAMVRLKNDQYFLPGSAVRGALRAQTRRIWQTLARGRPGDLNAAKGVEAKRTGDQKKLAAFHKMFGAPGWRAPIEVPDFELQGEARPHPQEYVAIDRFTGGAAEERKFSALGVYAPEFLATIRVDVRAWQRAGVEGWAVLLLLYLLRDLQEGDVQFGFGASKGFGACRGEIRAAVRGQIPPEYGGKDLEGLLPGVLSRDETALRSSLLEKWHQQLNKLCGEAT